jgi:hypothetical protein
LKRGRLFALARQQVFEKKLFCWNIYNSLASMRTSSIINKNWRFLKRILPRSFSHRMRCTKRYLWLYPLDKCAKSVSRPDTQLFVFTIGRVREKPTPALL